MPSWNAPTEVPPSPRYVIPTVAVSLHPLGEEHPRDDRDERAEHRDGGVDALLRRRRSGGSRPCRCEGDVARARYCVRTSRAGIPRARTEPRLRMSGREEVARLERERRRDGRRLLPERAVQAADDLALPVEVHEPLLEQPVQQHRAVEVLQALGGKGCRHVLGTPRECGADGDYRRRSRGGQTGLGRQLSRTSAFGACWTSPDTAAQIESRDQEVLMKPCRPISPAVLLAIAIGSRAPRFGRGLRSSGSTASRASPRDLDHKRLDRR